MKLIKPTEEYAESFWSSMKEFLDAGESGFLDGKENVSNAQEYIRLTREHEDGKNLPEKWIPYSTLWLIDNEEFIGEVVIRHELTPHLREIGGHIGYSIRPSKRRQGYGAAQLSLALPEAKKIGISKVLITCDENNFSSKKIIEKCGGVFEKAILQGWGQPRKLLFWITLT